MRRLMLPWQIPMDQVADPWFEKTRELVSDEGCKPPPPQRSRAHTTYLPTAVMQLYEGRVAPGDMPQYCGVLRKLASSAHKSARYA